MNLLRMEYRTQYNVRKEFCSKGNKNMGKKSEEAKEALGKQLKQVREAAGMTQQEMAEVCGISKNYISVIERGGSSCSAQILIDYAKACGVSLDVAAGISEEEHKTLAGLRQELTGLPIARLTEVLAEIKEMLCGQSEILPELQRVLSKMDKEEQKKVLDIIRVLQE